MGDEVIGSEDCLYLEVYEPITVSFVFVANKRNKIKKRTLGEEREEAVAPGHGLDSRRDLRLRLGKQHASRLFHGGARDPCDHPIPIERLRIFEYADRGGQRQRGPKGPTSRSSMGAAEHQDLRRRSQ